MEEATWLSPIVVVLKIIYYTYTLDHPTYDVHTYLINYLVPTYLFIMYIYTYLLSTYIHIYLHTH
jgi:hypothetical protein